MATTQFVSTNANAALIPSIWTPTTLFKFAFETNPLSKFMGEGSNSVVHINNDFKAKKGDTITTFLRGLLNEEGQGNDGDYEGYEEKMTFQDANLVLGERGHSTKLAGNMTEQRAAMNLRREAGTAIGEWISRVQARDIIDALSGMPNMKNTGHITGASAVTVATAAGVGGTNVVPTTVTKLAVDKTAAIKRWIGGGQTATGMAFASASGDVAITSAMLFGPAVIEQARAVALKDVDDSGNPVCPLRPIQIKGYGTVFLMLIDQWQAMQLRQNQDWIMAQRDANIDGVDNPLFTSAFGKWNDVLIHTTTLLHRRIYNASASSADKPGAYFDASTDSITATGMSAKGIGITRSLFLGAQACLLGWAKLPSLVIDPKDYSTKYAVHSDMIYGVKKAAFDARSSDGTTGTVTPFGCICVDTAVKYM